MSKVVKSVTRAVSSVVKGAVNVVKSVASGVSSAVSSVVDVAKSVASSSIGKIIITAAAVYFGGAALMGGMSGSAAGTGFLSGMGTGVANAATSLSGAWGSALSGNFSTAGSSLAAGFQGTVAAGAPMAMGAGSGLTLGASGVGTTSGLSAGAGVGGAGGLSAGASGLTAGAGSAATFAPTVGATLAGGAAPAAAAGKGLIGSLTPMGQYAAITGGTQLVGGVVQGYGADKAQQEQQAYEEQQANEQRGRYDASVQEFSKQANAGAARSNDNTSYGTGVAYDPMAESRALSDRYRAEFEARQAQRGIVGRGMRPTQAQPMANNGYPVYNPAYSRG
jgi:hypothetical protein